MDKIIDLRKKAEMSQETPRDGLRQEEIFQGGPEKPVLFSPEVISWTGFLYYHEPDMRAVWIAFGGFLALAVLLQIFQKNSITSALMGLIGLMILFQAKRKHQNIGEVIISPLGIKISQVNYIYSDIKSFWVDYHPENNTEELSIQLKKWYSSYIRLPIEGQDPVRIRNYLLQYVPEVEHETTLGEVIARRLGL